MPPAHSNLELLGFAAGWSIDPLHIPQPKTLQASPPDRAYRYEAPPGLKAAFSVFLSQLLPELKQHQKSRHPGCDYALKDLQARHEFTQLLSENRLHKGASPENGPEVPDSRPSEIR